MMTVVEGREAGIEEVIPAVETGDLRETDMAEAVEATEVITDESSAWAGQQVSDNTSSIHQA